MKKMIIKRISVFTQIKLLLFLLIILFNIKSFPQNMPEFIMEDSAFVGDMAMDDDNNLYVLLSRADEIFYCKYDSLFNPLSEFKYFSNTTNTSDTKFAIRNNYMVTVWRDFKDAMFYNSYIVGNISNLDAEINQNNFYVNEGFYDSNRFSPQVCFISDTTFFVIWYGEGPFAPNRQIYGRMFSVFGNALTSDILINEKYDDTSKSIWPEIGYSKSSNKLIITWISNYNNEYKLWGRLFYPNGEPIDSSFSISEASYINDLFVHDLDVDSSGNFVAAWALAKNNSLWELQWKWFDPDGKSITPIERLTTPEDSVGAFSYINIIGNYKRESILVWDYYNNNKFTVYAKFLLSDGKQIGSKFRISQNDTTFEIGTKILLNNLNLYCIWDADTHNWYGAFGRILDYDNPYVGVEDEKNHMDPSTFSLLQNYPNPFNSTTKIRYSVPSNINHESSNITIKVYDVLGTEITTLINNKQTPGEYEVEFNTESLSAGRQSLSSGVYIYIIKGGDLIKSNKMILLK